MLVPAPVTKKAIAGLGLREFFGQFTVNIPAMMMAISLASLPVLIFCFLAQEKVVEGLTAGALKGG
jgi:raffinose/stachyose/melibiose transport system permease protein